MGRHRVRARRPAGAPDVACHRYGALRCSSAQAASTWRRCVVRAPIDTRSTGWPSRTVRVNHAWREPLTRSIHASVASSVAEAQAHQVERVRRDDLEAVVGGDPSSQLLGEGHVLANHRSVALDAVEPQPEPQLERPEPAAEGHLPVAQVRRRAVPGRLGAQVLGEDAQRSQHRLAVGREEQVAVEVDAHPLVRVGAVAVGGARAVVDPPQLRGRARRSRSSPRRRATRRRPRPRRRRCRRPGRGRPTRWCRGWRTRRMAPVQRRGRRRSPRRARRVAWRTRRRGRRRASRRYRRRRCEDPSPRSSGPGRWRRRRAATCRRPG